MGMWMRATMGWLVVGMRVGAAWTEDGAEAVVMGDRDAGEDVQAEGVKVGVASLGMGMQVRGWGDGDGLGQTAGWSPGGVTQPGSQPRRRHPLCGPRALRGGGGGSSGGVPGCGGGDAPGGARLRVRARGGLGTRPGEGGGAGPGRRARRRRGRTGAGEELRPPLPRQPRHRTGAHGEGGGSWRGDAPPPAAPAPPRSAPPRLPGTRRPPARAPCGRRPPRSLRPGPSRVLLPIPRGRAPAAQPAQAWGSLLRSQGPPQGVGGVRFLPGMEHGS